MLQKFKKFSKEKFEGILVQKMVRGGEEVLVGGKKDPQFGQTIAFGLGGVFVEVMDDVAFRMVPIKRRDAEEMVHEIKGYKILKGYIGKSYDVKSIEDILLKVSNFLEKNKNVSELDVNPLIVSKEGSVAVDARIVLE
jgi:acyl-CoA synthetase (NDP forming)